MKVLILIDTIATPDQNHAYLANSFLDAGWEVFFGHINTLSTRTYHVYGDVALVTEKVRIYESLYPSLKLSHQDLEAFNLAWVMTQPHPLLAKDIWQILWMLSKRVPFVNSIESLVFLNNKNNLGLVVPPEHLLETYVSNQAGRLVDVYGSRDDERWVVKPTNASSGSDVYLLRPGDSNVHVILQSMTGNVIINPLNNQTLSDERQLGLQNHYCLLQTYHKNARQNEKRVLLAGGTVITQIGRVMANAEHRANLNQGGALEAVDLTQEETSLCTTLAERFLEYGVRFVGLDLAYPYVLEFNIANPGAISHTHEVTGVNFAPLVIARVLSSLGIE